MNGKKAKIEKEKPGVARRSSGLDSDSQPLGYIREPQGAQPREWRFTDYELALAKRAAKLRRDLDLEWEGVALALDLLEEVRELRAENLMLKQRLGRLVVE